MRWMILIAAAAMLLGGPAAAGGDAELAPILQRLAADSPRERWLAARDLRALAAARGPDLAPALAAAAANAPEAARPEIQRTLDLLAQPALLPFAETIAVFSETDLPAPKADSPFVVVNTGGYWHSPPDDLSFIFQSGFLLEETPETLTILHAAFGVSVYDRRFERPADLTEEQIRNAVPPDMPMPGQHRVLDFDEFVKHALGQNAHRPGFGDMMHAMGGGQRRPVELAHYGCWAFRRGQTSHAVALFTRAAEQIAEGDTGKLAEKIRESARITLRWMAISAANQFAPRSELLADWRKLLLLSGHDEASEAAKMVAAYESLLAEDEKFEVPAPDQFETLPPSEKAAILVHRLRDVAATQWMQPGWVSVFDEGWFDGDGAPPDGQPRNVAEALCELGVPAAKALASVLGDERPTRSMGYWRNFALASHYLVTHDGAAREILHRLTGLELPENAAAAQAAVLEWCDAVETTGEAAVLAATAEKGGRNALAAADRLVQRHPNEALGPLRKAVRATEEEWARGRLLELLGELPGNGPTEFLLEEMESATSLQSRLACARALKARGSVEAEPAMIEEWRRAKRGDWNRTSEDLVDFLAEAGTEAALRALAEEIEKRPVHARLEIVQSVQSAGPYADAGPARAAEELLAGRLEDGEPATGTSMWFGDAGFNDPRVSELAAYALSQLLPGVYSFDGSEGADRDAQIAAARAVWAARRAR